MAAGRGAQAALCRARPVAGGRDHHRAGMTWARVRKLLCVRLDSIGDVLMSTPAMRACKESFGCSLTLLTSAAGAAVAPLVPEIDATIAFAAPWMKPPAARGDEAVIRRLKAERFDAAVIFTVDRKSTRLNSSH